MSDRAAELYAALLAADTAPAILASLARATWHNAHDGAECPPDRTPALADLGAWLPDCPADVHHEAAPLLAPLLAAAMGGRMAGPWEPAPNAAARWEWLHDDAPADGAPGPRLFATADLRGSGPGRLRVTLTVDLAEVHAAWRAPLEPRPRHPLAPLVDAWQRLAPVPAEWDTRPHSVLPGTLAGRDGGLRPLVEANDPRQLPLDLTGGAGEPARQLWLGFEQPDPDRVPVLPLVAFDRRGGPSMTQGRGAAHAIRLYVEALLAVPPELRRAGYGPPASLHARLRDVVAGLWPRGWQRGRDWPRLLAGLDQLRKLGVEWEHGGNGGVWFAVTVRSVPRDARLDDLLRFEVLLPPGSGPGPMVARGHLRLLGLDSAPAYRLYLSLCWYWDHYGTARGRLIGAEPPQRRGKPVPPVKVGDKLVNPAALHHYPPLAPDHLAEMAYAPVDLADEKSDLRRKQRQRAREALDLIATVTGAVVIPAPGRLAGTVQVLPPASHKAAHDSKAELWHNLDKPT